MNKFYGEIGYSIQTETYPGVWEEQIEERTYSGDVIRNMSRVQEAQKVNDDINVDNKISIIADPFAYNNFYTMKYIRWMGALWKIKSVEVQRPRLILTIGGIYNGSEAV